MTAWSLVYDGFEPADEGLREALCTLGNGYFATRGAAPEATADGTHYPGTYVAGCYNRLITEVAGRHVENEDLVNVPNWLPLTFRIDGGQWFDLTQVELLSYRQELDLRSAILTRSFSLRDERGRRTSVTQHRLVSMASPHLAALQTVFVAEDWVGSLEVRSALDGRVTNAGVERYRELNGQHLDAIGTGAGQGIVWLEAQTTSSHIRIAQAARTTVLADGEVRQVPRRTQSEPDWVAEDLTLELEEGRGLTVEKVVALFTSRDSAIFDSALDAREQAQWAPSFDELRDRHALAWEQLWRRCHLRLHHRNGAGTDEDIDIARTLNLHMLHLLQTVSEHSIDLDVGVPARGLHGEAYRGHVFWDELFILPFLNLRFPELSRALLRYRWRRLPAARAAAREAGLRGAMYPWQSGSNGREETQLLHLNPRSGRWLPDNSHLQRHVNIAIAYNIWHYFQVTRDVEFLSGHGGEMLLEIARFWSSIATYNDELDRYEILGVMGPDEYHDGYPWSDKPGLDNNSYTNVMAVWTLRRALDALRVIPEHRRVDLEERVGLSADEVQLWEGQSRRMRVVFYGDGILSQFERYDELEELDWEGYRVRYGDIRRLDRVLEGEGDTPNRYKASKQADVLMLFYLLSTDDLADLFEHLGYPFDPGSIPRNVDYYLQRTSHGSTLSSVVHGWVLARTDRQRSWQFFTEALHSDVCDVQGGTTKEGIHLGAMAGTVDFAQRCFTGLEPAERGLVLSPTLPEPLERLDLDLRYRGHWDVRIQLTGESVTVSLPESEERPIRVAVGGKAAEVQPGGAEQLPVPDLAAVEAPVPGSAQGDPESAPVTVAS